MRALLWTLKILIFFVVLTFAVKNSEPIELSYYLGLGWRAPLVIVLFIFFFAGIVFSILTFTPMLFRLRRENMRLRRDAQKLGTTFDSSEERVYGQEPRL